MTRKSKPQAPPTSRMLDIKAEALVKEIEAADKNGCLYAVAILNGDVQLEELFDRHINPVVRQRVYRLLELSEQINGDR